MIPSLPNILIVDDIEVNLILLETALRKEQARIHKATGGEQALILTESQEFALIILDVSMPGMNGFELAAAIRKQQLNQVTPIIFISAILFDEFSISQGYRSGAVDYLAKPYHHEILLSKVRVFLQLFNQKQELQHQSQILRENNERLKAAQEILKLRLQLQKAASLASARFSGNFELVNSIHFMLRDIANVCGSSSAAFFPIDKSEPIGYTEGSHSALTKLELNSSLKSRLNRDFAKTHETSILISKDISGDWVLPYKKETNGKSPVSLAIRVASGEKHYGYILVDECSGISSWEASELNALSVFGTVTGNALERNLTRQELIASEVRYRSYIENAPEGIVITTNSGVIQEYNQAFGRMFSSYITGTNSLNILSILDKQNLSGHNPVAKNLLNGKLSQCEFNVSMHDKQFIILAKSVKLNSRQYLIFCTDITNERDLEKHIIQTERMVAIGEMATGLAHEINQPLNTISFGIDNLFEALAANKADDVYIKEKSNKIFDSIHRMRNIVDHVRNFARGNDDVILTLFSAEEPITNALSLFTEQLRNHGIEIVKQMDESVRNAYIHGNTYKIEQVLLNLYSNARDTMDDKKSLVGPSYQPVITLNGTVNNGQFVLTVSDNGMGMNAEQMKHITKPFFTGKAPGKGTGLGLAISQKIVAEHNGKLSFASIPSQGTTAKIELPVIFKESTQSVKL
ncbi:MAG TPA: response regulator [Lentimicrobium sp.]|nr:response regulator [Lentimicrobium sp.]